MTHQKNDSRLDAVMELLIENGFDGFADMLRILLNKAMRIERENALAARTYQRTPDRKGYANGYKPKTGRPSKPKTSQTTITPPKSRIQLFTCLIRDSFMVFGLKWTTHAPHATA